MIFPIPAAPATGIRNTQQRLCRNFSGGGLIRVVAVGRHKKYLIFPRGEMPGSDAHVQFSVFNETQFPKIMAFAVMSVFPRKIEIFDRHQFFDVDQVGNPVFQICFHNSNYITFTPEKQRIRAKERCG